MGKISYERVRKEEGRKILTIRLDAKKKKKKEKKKKKKKTAKLCKLGGGCKTLQKRDKQQQRSIRILFMFGRVSDL